MLFIKFESIRIYLLRLRIWISFFGVLTMMALQTATNQVICSLISTFLQEVSNLKSSPIFCWFSKALLPHPVFFLSRNVYLKSRIYISSTKIGFCLRFLSHWAIEWQNENLVITSFIPRRDFFGQIMNIYCIYLISNAVGRNSMS